MEVTLNKANKLLEKLKEVSPSYDRYGSMGVVSELLINSASAANVVDRLLAKVDAAGEELDTYFLVQRDIATLKERLFAANIQSGVSYLLSEVKCLKRELEVIRRMQKDAKGAEFQIDNPDLGGYVGQAAIDLPTARQVTVSVLPLALLDGMILERMRDLNRCEDQIAELNATKKVEITLSPASQKLLGIV